MYLVDSHCHLNLLDLTPHEGELSKAISLAEKQDVKHFLCVAVTLKDHADLLALTKKYPNISTSVGLHPNELDIEAEPTETELIKMADDEKVVAIGETGLDYYRSTGELNWQRDRFRNHIRAAKKIGKPLIVHSRQAKEDTLTILREEDAQSIGGVLHCFTEDWTMASEALKLNFYISFSGIVTFNNANEIQNVAKIMPLDRMLIETDSPYLAPIPNRGKPNEPANVRHVAEFIAKLRGIELSVLAEQTTENFFQLFKHAKR